MVTKASRSSGTVLVSIILILSFLTFQYFPYFGSYLREGWIVLLALFGCVYVLFFRGKYTHSLYKQFRFYTLVVICLSVYTSLMALKNYDQELFFGLLSQRSLLTCVAGLLLIECYRLKLISIQNIRDGFLFVCWFVFAVNIFLFLAVNPGNFSDVNGFAGGSASTRYYFHYQFDFIIFLFCYYFVFGLNRANTKYLLISLVSMAFLFFVVQKRAAIVALVFACAVHLVREFKLSKIVVVSQMVFLVLVLSIFGAYTFFPVQLDGLIEKFEDAFTVVLTGDLTSDASANTRILQLEIAKQYISENPILGNGRISVAWKDGYQTFINYRFFPSDMGVFGALFVYGILGCVVLAFQFYFPFAAFRVSRASRINEGENRTDLMLFMNTLIMITFYYFAYGIMHGTFFFEPGKLLIVSALLLISSIHFVRVRSNMDYST